MLQGRYSLSGDSVKHRRDALRFLHLFSLGLTWKPIKAAAFVAESDLDPYSGDMLGALSRAVVEGESLERSLLDYAESIPYEPLSGAMQSLLAGAETQDILNTLKRFVRFELELENREIDQRLGIRLTAAFLAVTMVLSASVVGSIPPKLLPVVSWVISGVIGAYLISKRLRR